MGASLPEVLVSLVPSITAKMFQTVRSSVSLGFGVLSESVNYTVRWTISLSVWVSGSVMGGFFILGSANLTSTPTATSSRSSVFI